MLHGDPSSLHPDQALCSTSSLVLTLIFRPRHSESSVFLSSSPLPAVWAVNKFGTMVTLGTGSARAIGWPEFSVPLPPYSYLKFPSTIEKRVGPFCIIFPLPLSYLRGHWLRGNIVDLQRIPWLPFPAWNPLSVWCSAISSALPQIPVVWQQPLLNFYRWEKQGNEKQKHVCKLSVHLKMLWLTKI